VLADPGEAHRPEKATRTTYDAAKGGRAGESGDRKNPIEENKKIRPGRVLRRRTVTKGGVASSHGGTHKKKGGRKMPDGEAQSRVQGNEGNGCGEVTAFDF